MTLPSSKSETLLLHNPKCSKSRATRALLEEAGIEFETRLYLEHPLDRAELSDLGRRLGLDLVDFTRTAQNEFVESGLSADSSDAAILDVMVEAPILMQRPVVVHGQRAIIGRPPEAVLALFDE